MGERGGRWLWMALGSVAAGLALYQMAPPREAEMKNLVAAAPSTTASGLYVEDLDGVRFGAVSPAQRRANTSIVNAALARGMVLRLRPGALLEISSSLILPSGSGLMGDGGGVKPTISMPAAAFTNRDDRPGPARYSPTGVAINFSGQTSGGFAPSRGVRLENLAVRSERGAGRRLRAIVGRNVADCTIRNVEVADLPSGVGIALSSARNCDIVGAYVHDFIDTAQWTFSPQSTGIEVDNDLVNNLASTDVSIRQFRIANITMEGASLAKWGYQTDGINVVNSRSEVTIDQGEITNVGEGIDTFGSNGSISNVTIRDAYIFGLKFIHGASRNVVRNILITNAGLAGVIFAGSDEARTDTTGNRITGLTIRNLDPNGAWKKNDSGGIIVSGRGSVRLPRDNQVIGADIDLGPNGKFGWIDGSTGSGNRASDVLVVPGRSLERIVLVQNGGSVVSLRQGRQP